MLLVAVVANGVIAAPAVLADASATSCSTAATASAVNTTDSCQTVLKLLLLRLWLSTLLCLYRLIMCAAMDGMLGLLLSLRCLSTLLLLSSDVLPMLSQVTLHEVS